MAFIIRAATMQDYESMVAVMLECDQHHIEHLPAVFCSPGGGSPTEDAHLARPVGYIEELLHDPNVKIFVAELQGTDAR